MRNRLGGPIKDDDVNGSDREWELLVREVTCQVFLAHLTNISLRPFSAYRIWLGRPNFLNLDRVLPLRNTSPRT